MRTGSAVSATGGRARGRRRESGYAMAGLLVAIGVMGVVMSLVLPVWTQAAQREREAELIFRGEQYVRAIELYQRQYVGAYPSDLDTLVEQGFLRRLYRDPMTDHGEFRAVYENEADEFGLDAGDIDQPGSADGPGENSVDSEPAAAAGRRSADRATGGIIGVVSTSGEHALRRYRGKTRYDEWAFIYTPGAIDSGVGAVVPVSGGRR